MTLVTDRPPTLILSVRRSGMNWLRHCAEHFSGIRTPGMKHLVAKGPFLFDRRHEVTVPAKTNHFPNLHDEDGKEVYGRVVLLLRNPFNCFESQYFARRRWSFEEGLAHFASYAENIKAFHDLKSAEKAVFYYEDYANQEAGTFAVLRFIGIEPNLKPYDFPSLIEASKAWYDDGWGIVGEDRPRLTNDQRAAIRAMLQDILGSIEDLYLGRYWSDTSASDESDRKPDQPRPASQGEPDGPRKATKYGTLRRRKSAQKNPSGYFSL